MYIVQSESEQPQNKISSLSNLPNDAVKKKQTNKQKQKKKTNQKKNLTGLFESVITVITIIIIITIIRIIREFLHN